jgi:erythrin-vacuolar iron transport family protein
LPTRAARKKSSSREPHVTIRRFNDLTEREILALAISSEEEDGRIYADFAEGLRDDYPASAHIFSDMAAEESGHRRQLIDLFVQKFGGHIPLVRRQDVRGWVQRRPIWQLRPLGIDVVRRQARQMEQDAARFYQEAASRTSDAAIRKLLGDLAAAEEAHEDVAARIEATRLPGDVRANEDDDAKRRFILQIIQPGLVGLMDGSVSTLAPVFAAAFATHNPWNAFLVGMAASIGAGISMGFAEALADDGKLSGRGAPLLRGLVCGLMTFGGGIGHTLPYLIPDFFSATILACVVVLIELMTIAWIQWRFMNTPPFAAAAKVMLGGGLVLAAGILIGSS